MNFLDFLRAFIAEDYTDTSRPGWAGRPSHMRKSRQPFKSSRKREIRPQTMKVEEFTDKDVRDARFRELRAVKGAKHINKFSTVRGGRIHPSGQHLPGQSIWCVVRP